MPLIAPDLFSFPGPVRIRASAPDPFAGLRGRAYIAARKLDKPVARIDDPAAANAKNESRENLISAINQRSAPASRTPKFVLASGSMEFLNESGDRRFWAVHLPSTEEA